MAIAAEQSAGTEPGLQANWHFYSPGLAGLLLLYRKFSELEQRPATAPFPRTLAAVSAKR
jgi:hypothetical protein